MEKSGRESETEQRKRPRNERTQRKNTEKERIER